MSRDYRVWTLWEHDDHPVRAESAEEAARRYVERGLFAGLLSGQRHPEVHVRDGKETRTFKVSWAPHVVSIKEGA